MTALSVQVQFKLTPEFLQDVMTTAVESAYEWFAFDDVQRLPAVHTHALSVIGFTAVEVDDNGEDLSKTVIDAAKIVEAISKILGEALTHEAHIGTVATACAQCDASHIDADLADCILQVACFDEIRYG